MTKTSRKQEKRAYLVFSYLDDQTKPKIVTRGFNHRLTPYLPGKLLENRVVGVVVSSDRSAVDEHEGSSYEDTPQGHKKMETDMHGKFVGFDRHQETYAELILEAVRRGAEARIC